MRNAVVIGLATSPLIGCQIVGGADYLDARDGSKVYAEWNANGTDFFTECGVDRQQITSPPREALDGILLKGTITERNYNRADFFVCPELAEVSE
ncbi:hypothetical protein [uncultured Roseobacter sp.]|uniref:hypothetical protein n=1 Tax=uncultured Roseobacter sp. TaxID=114847 RepID=UPI00262B94F8|nr:hypothetical protein [uncultured Roseobacter sp.]